METQMDLRKVEQIVKNPKGGIIEKKEAIISTFANPNSDPDSSHHEYSDAGVPDPTTSPVDSASALQLFLDHIPISSIPGIHNSPSTVLVVRTHECVKDGIRMLYEKNVSGALIADILEHGPTSRGTTSFSHPYVGFIGFSSMVLWSLQEFKKHEKRTKKDNVKGPKKVKHKGFFSMLDKIPVVSETKIGELAKSFLWDSVFPVKLDQTLFHVILLISKHRLSVVPVMEQSSSKVVGYVTENSVNHILLQSSGLEWFDSIADKPLLDFRFEHNDRVASIYDDQTVAEAVHVLWKKKVCVVAVMQRQTQKLIGCVRTSDIRLLLDSDDIFTNRETMSVGQFIHTNTDPRHHNIDHDLGALISAGTLVLNNKFEPRMDSPVTNTKTDTLKQVMKKLAETKSNFSFVVDEYQRVRGMVTLTDVMVEFAPPCMDSRIDGGGFFDMALQESGCTIKNGTMVHCK